MRGAVNHLAQSLHPSQCCWWFSLYLLLLCWLLVGLLQFTLSPSFPNVTHLFPSRKHFFIFPRRSPKSQNPLLSSGGTYVEGMIALLFTCSPLLGLCVCTSPAGRLSFVSCGHAAMGGTVPVPELTVPHTVTHDEWMTPALERASESVSIV